MLRVRAISVAGFRGNGPLLRFMLDPNSARALDVVDQLGLEDLDYLRRDPGRDPRGAGQIMSPAAQVPMTSASWVIVSAACRSGRLTGLPALAPRVHDR